MRITGRSRGARLAGGLPLVPLMFWLLVPVVQLDHPLSTVILDRQGELLGATIAADGQWRTLDGGVGGTPIDAAVELWDGTLVDGPVELRQALLKYSPQFIRMFTEKLMTYALGRGVEYFDMPAVRSIVREAAQQDYRFSSIVLGIVASQAFQMRVKSESPDGETVALVSGDR